MKREIKFRLWDDESHKWFIKGEDGLVSNMVCCDSWDMFDPDDYGWCQYTGLHDKNGREIYEGDLFEHRFGYIVLDEPPHDEMGTECGVVVLEDGQFGVKIPGLGVYNLYGLLLREGHLDNMPKDDLFVMKIAGNIYENPELLEGKQ